jgi:phosphate-selective porin OprO/OprP
MGDKEGVMHVGLSGLSSTYAVTPTGTSNTTSSADAATSRATINSFRSAGRGLANIFRGQVGGNGCSTQSYGCPSEYGAKVVQQAVGIEGIFARGPFKVMGEYSRGQYKGEHNIGQKVSYDTDTFYLEAGYFLTGEKYADSYKNGVFGGFKPKNNFDLDNGQLGAIELAFRVEGFRVDDTELAGGGYSRLQGSLDSYTSSGNSSTTSGTKSKADTYTAGIRWILNPNVVFKANYAYTTLGRPYAPLDVIGAGEVVKSEQIFMTRMQYMF